MAPTTGILVLVVALQCAATRISPYQVEPSLGRTSLGELPSQ